MLLGHPLDQKFAGDRPFDPLRLADHPEGIASHGEHRSPSLQDVGFLQPQRPAWSDLRGTMVDTAIPERTCQQAGAGEGSQRSVRPTADRLQLDDLLRPGLQPALIDTSQQLSALCGLGGERRERLQGFVA